MALPAIHWGLRDQISKLQENGQKALEEMEWKKKETKGKRKGRKEGREGERKRDRDRKEI